MMGCMQVDTLVQVNFIFVIWSRKDSLNVFGTPLMRNVQKKQRMSAMTAERWWRI